MVPLIVVTGPVGVGKSSVGAAISELLSDADLPHALIDMDHLCWFNRHPVDDPFNMRLGLRNLAAVWANYAAAGAERLVVVDVVEHRDDIAGYRRAVPGADVTVVRLRAIVETLHRRLEGRETGSSLAWHRARATELAAQMDCDRVEDIVVDSEGKAVSALAAEVLQQVGWLQQP